MMWSVGGWWKEINEWTAEVTTKSGVLTSFHASF